MTTWLRWSAAFALCIPFLLLTGLALGLGWTSKWLGIWAEDLAALIDRLTSD